MRNILLIAILFLVCSCSKYQYLKLSSATMKQTQTNEFVAENDSFRVVYKFWGQDGPVQIAVVNKSVTDLQVDWKKSWFITKKNKYRTLYTPKKRTGKLNYDDAGAPGGVISGFEIISPARSPELVLKNNGINKVSLDLFGKGFLRSGGHKKRREQVILSDMTARMIKKADFSSQNSPYRFRILLSLAVPGKPDQPIVIDNSFYVSELVAAKVAPEHLPELGDRVLVQKPTFTGAVLTGVGTVVGVVAVLIIKGWLESLGSED
jgi:hypothetical protein